MKKKILTLVLAAVMLVMALSLTACGPKYNTVDQIKENGQLVIYTEAGFAPYEFVYENEIVGVDIEIMKKVAEKLGVELVVEDVNFDSITGAVKGGKADAGAAGMTITAERAEEVSFSIPYASTEQYVIVTADAAIPTVEDLAGKTIGVQQGTTSDFLVDGLIADGTLAGATLTPFDAPALAAAALGAKVDAVVTDKLTAQVIVASSNGAYQTAKFVKADGSDAAEVEEYGVCVGKGNETLLAVIDEVLKELLADGSIAAWEQQYNDLYSTIEE
ncbi:MAG: transporter substrate-binding domain-containing protein [Clostridia bacterium]|nr:transporter substrate-binding domain-containing protein [Clostridia bacterium]